MTAEPSRPTAMVFDSSVLSAFASARRLPVLRDLAGEYRLVTTQAVLSELRVYHDIAPETSWLETVRVDDLAELQALVGYADLLGSGEHDMGEATVMAWAEVHRGIVIIDDRAAKRAGKRRGVECHGTLWLIIDAFRSGVLVEADACALVDVLSETDARFPCAGADLFEWARGNDLLDEVVPAE